MLRVRVAFAFLVSTLAAFPLQAEETLALDRFSFAYGEYAIDLTAGASYKRASDADPRHYGVSDGRSLPFFELTWRPFDRHQIRGAWFDHGRGSNRTLNRDVEVGDTIYPIGATLDGQLAVNVLELDYTYWAWLSRRNAFGPVVGIVSIDVDSAMTGTIDIGDIGAVDVAAQAGESLIAPKLGVSYVHAFNDKLRLTADVATFERGIRGGDAQIWDTTIGAEWNPWNNVGFALRHARTRIDVDVARSGYDGSAEVGFTGWQFLLRARW